MESSGRAVFICGRCAVPITSPLASVADVRLIERVGWDPWAPQGSWARAERAGSVEARLSEEHPISVHPHDLLLQQLVVSGFGCCGYTPVRGPNLHCRCGAPVGFFVDECSFRIEVGLAARFDAVHASPEASPEASARISARLDRLARTRLSPVTSYPDTRWDWRACDVASVSPREVGFALEETRDGLAARFIADEESIALTLSTTALARAIALGRLPVGNRWLALSFGVRDDANRVSSSSALVRREHEIEVVEEIAGRARGWRVWDEWLEDAWEQAVDRWITSSG